MGSVILAGDIGGTKTVIATFEPTPSGLERRDESTFASRDHATLSAVVASHLSRFPATSIGVACFGVSGPVVAGRARITNLPWELDENELARACGADRVVLLNDLEATAYGVLDLDPSQRETLQDRPAEPGACVSVIAAGTGLGEAMLTWDGNSYRAVASEGGHASFAPRTDDEIELLRFLRAEFGHVSTERVLSGPGLHNIYRFVRQQSGSAAPAGLDDRLAREDPGAVIAEFGLAGTDAGCVRALKIFTALYGAAAGDLALRCVSLGGVYLCGGIAPKILPALRGPEFLDAFRDKGRFGELLDRVPVHVALDPATALFGAARHASTV